MTPSRNSIETASQLISQILRLKSCVLVAIDGHGGAGKSSFANTLANKFDGQIVHNDDFYRVMDPNTRFDLDVMSGASDYFDWQRLNREVLIPMKKGVTAKYQKYNWEKNELGMETTVKPSGVVIIEGVYSFRHELNGYYDLGILIECPREIRMKRLSLRVDDPKWIKKWDDAELWYFDNGFREEAISLKIDGF